MKKEKAIAYRQGLAAGTAAEVRAEYHREQLLKELPEPPLPKRYYEVPVPAHTTSDGLEVEAHKTILEIVQP